MENDAAMIPQECFNIDAASLSSTRPAIDFLASLYSKYRDELIELGASLSRVRARMIGAGFRADFGDAESELLYLFLRELQPEVVVEISPCHGYSTNYILAALQRNGKGRVFSYEIAQTSNGQPTADAIRANLLDSLDRSRLELLIGDATTATIPDADFLFIDSCHEAWFAAWYMRDVLPRAKLCFIHDIVMGDEIGAILPKSPFTGIRESYQVLEVLASDQRRFLASIQVKHALPPTSRSSIQPRFAKGPEFGVILPGGPLGTSARSICDTQLEVFQLQRAILDGDRLGVVEEMRAIVARPHLPVFAKLAAFSLLPALGYRSAAVASEFPAEMKEIIAIAGSIATIAQLGAVLELGAKLADHRIVSTALTAGRRVNIATAPREFLATFYRQFALPFNRLAAGLENRVRRFA
jgi:hypothetical protein